MKKLNLEGVTLLGIDCIDLNRLLKAFTVCEKYCNFGDKRVLTSLSEDRETESGIKIINIGPINSREEYSKFMMRKLNDYVETEHVLIVQYDGFILNPKAWTEEYLRYDYIGAPWWYGDEFNVGNGGFSLRSKKLLEILQKDKNIVLQSHHEDHQISRIYGKYLRSRGIKFAPENLARKFSIEGNRHNKSRLAKYGDVWDGEFGFHGFHKTDISKWESSSEF